MHPRWVSIGYVPHASLEPIWQVPMLAAQAGAEICVSLEATKPMSTLVAKICGANKVRGVLPCHDPIEEMEVGEDEDLEEQASVLTMEVVDVCLLGSQFARFVEARASPLVSPAVKCVPRRARLFAVALELPYQAAAVEQPIFEACGFDLSSFNAFRTNDLQLIPLNILKGRRALSEPTELFGFDFETGGSIEAAEVELNLLCTEAGTWHAVAVWYEADLDEEGTVVSNEPSVSPSGSLQGVVFLPGPVEVSPGEVLSGCCVSICGG